MSIPDWPIPLRVNSGVGEYQSGVNYRVCKFKRGSSLELVNAIANQFRRLPTKERSIPERINYRLANSGMGQFWIWPIPGGVDFAVGQFWDDPMPEWVNSVVCHFRRYSFSGVNQFRSGQFRSGQYRIVSSPVRVYSGLGQYRCVPILMVIISDLYQSRRVNSGVWQFRMGRLHYV